MHIRPFQSSDHPILADISVSPMVDDPAVRYFGPGRHQHRGDLRAMILRNLKSLHTQPGVFTMVAVTDVGDAGPNGIGVDSVGGRVVGRVTVERLGSSEVAKRYRQHREAGNRLLCAVEAGLLAAQEKYVALLGMNRAIDMNALMYYLSVVRDPNQNPLTGDQFQEMWMVLNLIVDEQYQRRGVGTLLMRWVMAQARHDGVPVGLRASEKGRGLYNKLNFKTLLPVTWDGGKSWSTAMAWNVDEATGSSNSRN